MGTDRAPLHCDGITCYAGCRQASHSLLGHLTACQAAPPAHAAHGCPALPCRAGGRVTGPAVISELITELHASVEAAAGFEGEMQNLASYAAALAMALECIRDCGDSRWALQQGSP